MIGQLWSRLTSKAGADQRNPADPTFNFLKTSALLAEVSAQGIEFLNSRVVHRRYVRHEMIFRQDNPGVCMFIIEQGQVDIFTENDNGDLLPLTSLNTGALFGEISASFGNKRTASARAHCNDTLLLTVSRFDLNDLNKKFPDDGLQVQKCMSRSIVGSLITTTNQVRELQRQVVQLQLSLERHERK